MRGRRGLRARLSGFRDLLAFATGIPLGGGSVEAAAAAFPLAPLLGALEGLLASLALAALGAAGVPGSLAGAVYLVLHVAITGALHLDGFSDYADVVGSRLAGEGALRVLKDPSRGSYALAWTTVALVASAAAAGSLAPLGAGLLPLLTAVYAFSAEAMYLVIAAGRREPYEGLAGAFKDSMDGEGHAVNAASYAGVACLSAAAALQRSPLEAALVAVAAALAVPFSLLVARDAESRLGFVNGDVAGFAYEALRTFLLTMAALALSAAGG
ncbi:adenosylcobinamide-GDP ribazoletransferase [Stetteria hydrogenophila]